MPQYADIYFLSKERSVRVAVEFLGRIMPQRSVGQLDWVIENWPETGSELIFTDYIELMEFLENKGDVDQAVYCTNLDKSSNFECGMIFFTDDDAMIMGVSIPGRDPADPNVLQGYKELCAVIDSSYSCITIEEPPPYNSAGFIEFCKKRFVP